MPVISDETGIYTVGCDGKKRYATGTNFAINGEPVYLFDLETGVLKISICKDDIKKLIDTAGGLPAEEITLPTIFGEMMYFHNVRELQSLPRKNGTFFLNLKEKEVSPPKSNLPAKNSTNPDPPRKPTKMRSLKRFFLTRWLFPYSCDKCGEDFVKINFSDLTVYEQNEHVQMGTADLVKLYAFKCPSCYPFTKKMSMVM